LTIGFSLSVFCAPINLRIIAKKAGNTGGNSAVGTPVNEHCVYCGAINKSLQMAKTRFTGEGASG